jgi:hypothetical protein
MEVELSDTVRTLLLAFLILALPLILIIVGLYYSVDNVWFYLLTITWFGCGLIFYGATR